MSDDVELIRRLVRDVVHVILDEEVLGPLLRVLSGFEESILQFKRDISQRKLLEKRDSDKIRWEQATGPSGSYERSEDVNNPEFKALLKDLMAHNGKLTRECWFYWVFGNNSTIGRKKRK